MGKKRKTEWRGGIPKQNITEEDRKRLMPLVNLLVELTKANVEAIRAGRSAQTPRAHGTAEIQRVIKYGGH